MLKRIVSGVNLSSGMANNPNRLYRRQFVQRFLHCFANLRRWGKFGPKDDIPKAASNSETILIVHEVVLKVVLLQLSPVRWKRLMVKEVVSEVIAYIPKYSTTEDSSCSVPIPEENCMCEFPEWYC
jgi:hypothetical protein